MISTVAGTATHFDADSVVVLVGGVGMRVLTTPHVLGEVAIGKDLELFTTLIVREDSLTLYGFSHAGDRNLFEKLQSVSGIGPRIALAALSVYGASDLRDLILTKDEKAITRIPGIGKKGAQRLILELADKVAQVSDADPQRVPLTTSATAAWQEQVAQGLTSLGWSTKEAQDAVIQISVDAPIDISDGRSQQEFVAEMLAKALRLMGRAREVRGG